MKEENGDQGVGATAFDYPNNQHPNYENRIYHTSIKVPKPNNAAAMNVDHAKVMNQVLNAK
jgi:hypothetical protein